MNNFNQEKWEADYPGVSGAIEARKILFDLAQRFYRSGMTPKQWVDFIETKPMFQYFTDIIGGKHVLKHLALFVWFPMK